METFVLLPFFLLSRVPTDANTWRYGPEYTFLVGANVTALEGRSIFDFSVYQMCNTLKCRPRDSDTLHCWFGTGNLTMYRDSARVYESSHSLPQLPFEVNFDRWGIQNLVVSRHMLAEQLDKVRAFLSQINIGVEVLHQPDGTFTAIESSYNGQCETLVNVSREYHGNEDLEGEDYEIVPMSGIRKEPGEVLVIEKTRNLKNCMDKRDFALLNDLSPEKMQVVSSRSRIVISATDYNSYTENTMTLENMRGRFSFCEKININLVSVLPAQEALKQFSDNKRTVSPYAYNEN